MRPWVPKLAVTVACVTHVAARVGTKTKGEELGFCSPMGKPNFKDGDFSAVAFAKEFEPKCSCVDEDNTIGLLAKLETAVGSPNFVEVFQRSVGDARGEKSYECINGCEVCLPTENKEDVPVCGLLETDVTYKFGAAMKDTRFDLKSVLSGIALQELESQKMLGEADYAVEFCVKYTSGHEGRLCFGAELKSDEDDACFVGYDGKRCASCDISEQLGKHCISADCSNIPGFEKVDTCSGEGLTGAFEFVDMFFNEPNPELMAGSCGDFKAMHDSKP